MYTPYVWVDGFAGTLFGIAALIGAGAYRPDLARYFMRGGPPSDLIEQRPLGMRTFLVALGGAFFSAGAAVAVVPDAAPAVLGAGACAGVMAATIIWTALVLVPRGQALPSGAQSGRLGTLLRRMGRRPWTALAQGLVGGMSCGALVGLLFVLRFHETGHEAVLEMLPFTVGAAAAGTMLAVYNWANVLGEYARTGTLP